MVLLKTNRNSYDRNEAAKYSMTVGELIEELSHCKLDDKIVFCNDNGHTYGDIQPNRIKQVLTRP